MIVRFSPQALAQFQGYTPKVRREIIFALNTQLFMRVRKAASGSGFYFVDVNPKVRAWLRPDKSDPELLWVLGFGPLGFATR